MHFVEGVKVPFESCTKWLTVQNDILAVCPFQRAAVNVTCGSGQRVSALSGKFFSLCKHN